MANYPHHRRGSAGPSGHGGGHNGPTDHGFGYRGARGGGHPPNGRPPPAQQGHHPQQQHHHGPSHHSPPQGRWGERSTPQQGYHLADTRSPLPQSPVAGQGRYDRMHPDRRGPPGGNYPHHHLQSPYDRGGGSGAGGSPYHSNSRSELSPMRSYGPPPSASDQGHPPSSLARRMSGDSVLHQQAPDRDRMNRASVPSRGPPDHHQALPRHNSSPLYSNDSHPHHQPNDHRYSVGGNFPNAQSPGANWARNHLSRRDSVDPNSKQHSGTTSEKIPYNNQAVSAATPQRREAWAQQGSGGGSPYDKTKTQTELVSSSSKPHGSSKPPGVGANNSSFIGHVSGGSGPAISRSEQERLDRDPFLIVISKWPAQEQERNADEARATYKRLLDSEDVKKTRVKLAEVRAKLASAESQLAASEFNTRVVRKRRLLLQERDR